MPRKHKNIDAEIINMGNVRIDRLKELVEEIGGKMNFLKKLDSIRTDNNTDIKSLNGWLKAESGMDLYRLYLVANAYNISADWLLGLNDVKDRDGDGFIAPATYGDVLIFLDNLFKKGGSRSKHL